MRRVPTGRTPKRSSLAVSDGQGEPQRRNDSRPCCRLLVRVRLTRAGLGAVPVTAAHLPPARMRSASGAHSSTTLTSPGTRHALRTPASNNLVDWVHITPIH